MKNGPRIGIDLGGTKIELILLRGQEILHRERQPTPQGDYDSTLQIIKQLVDDAETKFKFKASVGIGTPGAISRKTGVLKNSNSTCLNHRPLLEDLQHLLGREVRISNDANCFALSEATDGAAANAQCVFGVIIGTGTGAGIVVNQQVLNGPNAIAGEWGHNPLPWPQADELPGPKCYCGKRGCIETFLSGPGLSADHMTHTGANISAEQIVELSRSGDEQAEFSLQRYEDRLARSLAHVINILDPDCIVLGGGMSNIERLYSNVPRLWGKYVFSDQVDTPLVRAMHGDSSGVRGAAWLWNS